MREILFKAKRKDNGEWVEGNLIHRTKYYGDDADDYFILEGGEFASDYYFDHEVIPETICQYTGLTDKNGNRIWENDIVRYQFDNDDCPFPNKHTEKIIGRIFFSDFRASFSITAGENGSSMLNNDLFKYVQNGNRVEVIGNVFDNADLLKESED